MIFLDFLFILFSDFHLLLEVLSGLTKFLAFARDDFFLLPIQIPDSHLEFMHKILIFFFRFEFLLCEVLYLHFMLRFLILELFLSFVCLSLQFQYFSIEPLDLGV